MNSLAKTGSSLQMNMYVDNIAVIFKNKSMTHLEIDGFLYLTTLFLNLNIKDLYEKQIKTICIIIKIRYWAFGHYERIWASFWLFLITISDDYRISTFLL